MQTLARRQNILSKIPPHRGVMCATPERIQPKIAAMGRLSLALRGSHKQYVTTPCANTHRPGAKGNPRLFGRPFWPPRRWTPDKNVFAPAPEAQGEFSPTYVWREKASELWTALPPKLQSLESTRNRAVSIVARAKYITGRKSVVPHNRHINAVSTDRSLKDLLSLK
jgi:hypothetical protein